MTRATKNSTPPTGLPPTHNPTTSEPSPNIINQEPAPSSLTPNLGRNPGDIDEVVAMLDSSIREVDGIGDQLAYAWQQTVASLGSVTEIHPAVCGPGNPRGRVVTVGIDCQHGPFQLRVRGIGQVLRTRSRTGIPR